MFLRVFKGKLGFLRVKTCLGKGESRKWVGFVIKGVKKGQKQGFVESPGVATETCKFLPTTRRSLSCLPSFLFSLVEGTYEEVFEWQEFLKNWSCLDVFSRNKKHVWGV